MRFDYAGPGACDRCGRPAHIDELRHDGIGDVCKSCRNGAEVAS